MTAAPPDTLPPYAALGARYGSALDARGIGATVLTHKWQPTDLLAPHSDLDVRVLLRDVPEDWQEWNHRLATAHRGEVRRDATHRRLLEHPPGFAFTLPEAERQLISPPELATWSLVRGNARDFQRWKSHAQMAPWSRVDERFYRGILHARLGGRYQLAADSTDNVSEDVPGYRRHCVAWHYLAPCWFAAAALATRTRCPGKTAALTQWHPNGLERYAELFLRHAQTAGSARSAATPTARRLLRTAHVALEAVMRRVPGKSSDTDTGEGEERSRVAWTMTAGMLRVRIARWLYYLDPPPGVATGYLITREAKELRTAAEALRTLAADETSSSRRLAGRMAELIPTGPTTADTLRDALALWDRRRSVVQDFLTAHAE
ncbi:hypothetical protein LHJ74_07880 [Streptomyces sp. N2-109]|uniref:Nucleotidyltransferase domain-containing protein n=1 Tax=Streptomyces gossypii TaxID=2883101 RepID=A0ABT2JQ50_9ACTN|nr:hypothetical protein [Streptomyces gossypii]MCT2589833.1 hypothetical protein [Streptomyces gossypii]